MASASSPSTRLVVVCAVLLLAPALSGCFGSGPGLFYDPGQNGAWGKEFLSAAKYSRLIVEIDYEPGGQPEQATVARLQSVLETYLNKPRGIDVRQASDVSAGGASTKHSFSAIRNLEDGARDHYKGGDDAVLYVLFLAGGSSEDSGSSRVLGAAYSGSSVVMFKDNIKRAATNCGSPFGVGCPPVRTVEEAVMVHEVGHILGLVNNGIPMVTPHEDAQHPGHSSNEDSVMYWKVETGNIVDLFMGGQIPTEFDANDRADMCNAGGRCP